MEEVINDEQEARMVAEEERSEAKRRDGRKILSRERRRKTEEEGGERERRERERGEEEEREAFPPASPHDGISIARRCEERVRRCRGREKERLLERETHGGEKGVLPAVPS